MSGADDIAFEDPAWLHLRATEKVSRAFSELNLFLVYNVILPVNPNTILRIPKSAKFENYTSSYGQIYSAGAFTYSENKVTNAYVGRYCSLASGLTTMGERHPIEQVTSSAFTYCYFPNWHKPQFLRAQEQLLGNAYPPKLPASRAQRMPVLENDVWIGQNVILAQGITLRTGCVVGAGSVVTKDVPPYTIVGGNPARPIRLRFPQDLCERLLATQWWNYHPRVLFEFGFEDVKKFCDEFENAQRGGDVEPMPVRTLTWKDVLEAIANA